MATRRLEPLLVSARPAAVEHLTRLRRALDGTGPALLPLPADNAREAARMANSLLGDHRVTPDTALVIGTSGSEGEIKGVLLSAEAIFASAAATHARLNGPGRWLLALSARYIGGLQVLVRSLVADTVPSVLDGQSGFRPEAFVHASRIMPDDRPRYTALVPTQLVRLLTDPAGIDALRTFDAVLLGGSATPEPVFSRAQSLGIAAIRTYGMSETASGCVYEGYPLAGVQVRLTEIANGSGRIELAGPMLAHGYRSDPAGTAAAFQNGWFRTNDLGRFSPDGHLTVLGRIDDLINTGGVKVSPLLVEQALLALPDVEQACVVGIADPEWGQRVTAAIVPRDPANPPIESRLRYAVRDQLGSAAEPRRFLFLPALPLAPSGKIIRTLVKDMFS